MTFLEPSIQVAGEKGLALVGVGGLVEQEVLQSDMARLFGKTE